MTYSDHDRLTALAGVYQAAWCAHNIAKRGMADTDAMEACIHAVFQTDSDDVPSIYGGAEKIVPGLRQFINQINGDGAKDVDLTRYVIALLQLDRKLAGIAPMEEKIHIGVENTKAKLNHFHLLHPSILAQLAEVYSNTISTLSPRIMVKGEVLYLQNPDNADKIRSLLLSGIRSARLWFQVGGRRTHLLFRRRRLVESAHSLLNGLVV